MTSFRHPSLTISALALAAAVTVSGVAPALAQGSVLGTIIIQADRSPMQKDQIGRSLTVITGEQLEKQNIAYVADALRQIPGVAIASYGSKGSSTHARIRGGEPNYTLVMIDGVIANGAGEGDFNFGQLLLGEVERIEVLRGPQGAFWGSNAVSGVINIVTKAGVRQGLRTTIGTEFGTDGTRMGSVLLQYGQDNFNVAGSLAARHTDGFNISSFGDEKDGAQHVDTNVKFRADLTPSITVDGNLRYGDSTAHTDEYPLIGDSFDTTRSKEFLGSLGGRWANDEATWFQSARFSAAKLDMLSKSAYPDYEAASSRYKGSYQLGHTLFTPEFSRSEHTVTVGYDFTHERYDDTYWTAPHTRTNHALIGEYRGKFDNQFFLTAALRHDFNDKFRDFTSYSLSGAWQIPDTGTRLHASLGNGAVNPTFSEQFYKGIPGFNANPNLRPEQTLGWDIGVEQKLLNGAITLDATYFGQRVEDLIKSDNNTVINLDGISTRQGLELTAAFDFFNGFIASASYTYTEAKTALGQAETRRPTHTGVVNLSYSFEDIPLTLNANANFVGATTDTAFTQSFQKYTVDLPAFTELGAGLSYKVNDNVEVFGRVTNLLNTPNQSVYGYNSPGRTFYLGAKASF